MGRRPQSLYTIPFTGSQSLYIEQLVDELLELVRDELLEDALLGQCPSHPLAKGPLTIVCFEGLNSASGTQYGSLIMVRSSHKDKPSILLLGVARK
jgi:hypothetical protein